MNLQDGVNLSEGLIITLFSMGIVFLTLIIISLILWGFKLIFYKKKRSPTGDDEELIAVIAAAIEAYTEENVIVAAITGAVVSHSESNVKSLNIKSIRKTS